MGKTKVQRIVPLAVARNERLLAALSERKRTTFNEILDHLQVQVEDLLAHPKRTHMKRHREQRQTHIS
jgi:hypothetical protein